MASGRDNNITAGPWLAAVLGCLLSLQGVAAEESIAIESVSSQLVDEVYQLDAQIDYDFNAVVLEALESGVPITLEMEIQVYRRYNWRWDETIATLNQRYRIKYHALTRQYLVTNLNSDVQVNYPTLSVALYALGTVTDLPMLDKRLLNVGQTYWARMKVSLVLGDLPSPLRLWAYVTPEWWQSSEWYTWRLQ